MASDFIAMALNDIELLHKEFRIPNVYLDFLKVDYRLLETFLLCARKWDYGLTSKSGNNVNLKSLLSSIESTVCENMMNLYDLFLSDERFHKLGLNYHMIHIKMGRISCDRCLMGKSSTLGSNSSSIPVKKNYSIDRGMHSIHGSLDAKVEPIRRACIGALRNEISESYFSLLDYYSSLQYHSSWDQQLIMEFIDSLLVNVEDIQTWIRVDDQFLRDLNALKEKVTFLKNFISFAEWQGCEQRQLEVLFSHLFVVAINAAASVFYMWSFCWYDNKEEFDNEMWLSFSQRVQMMNPVDSQICETCIQVLTAWNNPSGSSHARTLETKMDTILGDFVGSLLYQAWQALTRGTTFMVSLEDQMPILWDGLRFLRTILKKHLEKLPNKVKDLIAAAVTEAGIVICPLLAHKLKEALAMEMDIALFNLLGKIKLIKVVASAFIFPKTDEIGFVDFFLENLKALPSCKVDSIVLAKDQIQTILEDLVSLRSLLDDILEQRNHHEKIQALCYRVAEVAYKAQFIIQSLVAGDISDSSPTIFNPITQEIDLIKTEALKIGDNKCSFATPKAIRTSNPLPSRGSTPAVNKVELRLGDEVNKTIELLTRGSKQLDIISIVGMPGLGKTTLARNVYDDPSITDVFHIRAWCVVSQAYTKKDLVLQILGCIFPKLSDHDLKKNESDLEEELKKCLLRNKYLIVFDDVWDSEAWSGLKTSFPNDVNGSRILLTSRHADVARKINPNREPHPLRQLTDNESWELLQTKLSCREGYNVELGRKIAENCKGLPLTVVIVAGILANLGLDGWEEIAERLSLSALSNTEHCVDILELSYRNLPDYLKPCLLYFGAFPEDQEIPFGKLMRLWIAEGFVQKSDRMSLEDMHTILGDFVGSLLYHVWQALTYGTTYMVSSEDQMPILWEGLRFLRTILKKQLEMLPNNVKGLIAAAVNEAALVICPLLVHEFKEGLAKEMDIALFNLLGKIKLIKVAASAFIFPRTDEIGFMDFFLENLKELPSCKVDSIVLARDQIQTTVQDLVSLRSLLDNIVEQRNQHEKIQALRDRVAEVAYKAQFIIQSLVAGDIPDSSPMIFNPITQEIDLIKMEALKIDDNKCSFAAQKASRTSNPLPSRGSDPAVNKVELRLDDEANKTIELLTTGSKQLDIISIVGMPGLGKTTLAKNVYDDPLITDVFHIRAWCVVSQVYRKKDLVLQILGCIIPELSDQYLEKSEYDLEEELRKRLMRNKYLIVLDDVWESEVWSGLERSFPNDVNGSRILLTSRHADVARKINPNREPHPLRQLTDNESWELLQTKLSCREGFNVELGRKIAKNCKGLPLTVVIVAGILANLGQDGWEEIAGRLSLSALSSTEQCMDIIELSYRNLPDYLKPCLLYFGAFPEDQEIPSGKLMRLWIAEGFVQKSDQMSLEDVAKDYMNDLIGRSLVMISKERSIGGVKACRIHDLLHEFCLIKAKKENFLCLLRGYDEIFTFNEQSDLQRLCVYSQQEHFQELRIFCPNLRSLLYFPLAWCGGYFRLLFANLCIFKLVKVLDLVQINLGFIFPSELLLLVELRYLAVRGEFESIPPSITNLSNLETLLVRTTLLEVVLPVTFWKMQNLRYLLGCFSLLASSLATDNLEISSDLHNLDTFSLLSLSFGQSMEKILRKLLNVRRLKCILLESWESTRHCNRIVETSFLSQLQSLHLQFNGQKDHIEFRFPLHLKKLSLTFFHWSTIQEIRDLPDLEVLKLESIEYEGGTWDMEQEWLFSRLKYLKLEQLFIGRWSSSGDHFPSLEKLVLEKCWALEEVPSCLEDIPALQMIKVSYCPNLVKSSLGKIEEEQKNSGNEDFKIHIFNSYEGII